MHHHNFTRGFGFLETLLAKKRARVAEWLIVPNLRDGRVLDIGCGSFPYFLSTTRFKEKYGVDGSIDETLFQKSPIKLKKLNVEITNLTFSNNFFDVVIMLAVFEHIHPEFIHKVLNDIYRVLKKDGQLIITTPSPWSVPLLWTLSRVGFISKVEINDHKHAYTHKKIIKLMRNAGFSKDRIEHGYFELTLNMWFIARK